MRNRILAVLILLCSVCLGQSVPNTTNFNLKNVTFVLGGNSLRDCINAASVFPQSFWDSNYSGSKNSLYNFRNYTISSYDCDKLTTIPYYGWTYHLLHFQAGTVAYYINFKTNNGLFILSYNNDDASQSLVLNQGSTTKASVVGSYGSLWRELLTPGYDYMSTVNHLPLRFIYNTANGTVGTLYVTPTMSKSGMGWALQSFCPSTCDLGTFYTCPDHENFSFYFPSVVRNANYSLYIEKAFGTTGSTCTWKVWNAAGDLSSTGAIDTYTPPAYPSTSHFNTGSATGVVIDISSANPAYLDTWRIKLTRDQAAPVMASTTTAYSITQSSVWTGGTIDDDGGSMILNKGIAYGTGLAPLWTGPHTDNGTGSGPFDTYISSLASNTTYHYRSYAHNAIGEGYGPEYTFTTSAGVVAPTVTTASVTGLGTTTATVGGNATNAGNGTIDSKGVFYSNTTSNPNETNSTISVAGSGLGSYTNPITGLSSGKYYYYRAYAHNSAGYGYGSISGFWTNCDPVVLSAGLVSPTGITSSGFTAGGNVTSLGGCDGATEGICAAVSPTTPTTANYTGVSGSGLTGPYTASITGLSPGTLYNYRSYATNTSGTTYGTQGTVTTLANLPTVTTTTASQAYTYITYGGNVTSTGGATTSKGVYYGTSPTPTSGTAMGIGTGAYSSNITSAANTKYYYRAYATNSAGISYGAEYNITTPNVPTVSSTTAATSITGTTASTGGNITSNGGQALTAAGVCYAVSPTVPTISNSVLSNGNVTGTYTSNLTGLTAGTAYIVRAFATNYFGTTYAPQISFTTSGGNITITWSCTVYPSSGGHYQVQINGGAPVVNQSASGSGSFVCASGATILQTFTSGSRVGCGVTMTGYTSGTCVTTNCTATLSKNPTVNVTISGSN